MLKKLKRKVYNTNIELTKHKIVTFTWGNVSGIDREQGLFVIKPLGMKYEDLNPADMQDFSIYPPLVKILPYFCC